MFTRAEEFSGTVAVSFNVPEIGGDAQAAYAITDHFAVMANGAGIFRSSTNYNGKEYPRSHFFGEGGVGYYLRTDKTRFEMFAGYGKGKSRGQTGFPTLFLGNSPVITSTTYDRFFIQPSIGTDKQLLNFSLTTRISGVSFTSYSTTDQVNPTITSNSGFHWFFEPAVTANVHVGGSFRTFFQFGISVPLGPTPYFESTPAYLGFGIQYHGSEKHRNEY